MNANRFLRTALAGGIAMSAALFAARGAIPLPAGASTAYPAVAVSNMSLSCIGSGLSMPYGVATQWNLSAHGPTVSGSPWIEWKADVFKQNGVFAGESTWVDDQPGPYLFAGLTNGGATSTWYLQTWGKGLVSNPARYATLEPDESYALVDTFYYYVGNTWVSHQYQVVITTDAQHCNIPTSWTKNF